MAISPNIANILAPGIAAQFGAGVTLNNVAHPNNSSDNPDDWDENERVKLAIWFMKMHHEEDIKGFKAMRDIERSVERAQWEEQQRQQIEFQKQFLAQQQAALNQAQNSYTFASTNRYSFEEPKKESWWKKLLK